MKLEYGSLEPMPQGTRLLHKDYPDVSDQDWKDWMRDRNKAMVAAAKCKRMKEDPEFRAKENARSLASYHKRMKENPEYRAKENARTAAGHRKRREDPGYRAKRNAQAVTSYHKRMKEDPEFRAKRNAARLELHHKRMKEDPGYRLKIQLRDRLKRAVKRARVNRPVPKDRALYGCDSEFLVNWIEKQWQPGWTWNNQGTVWHLDHIKPLSSFNLNSEYDLKMCNRFTNLRPLCAKENMSKGAKIVEASHRPVKV